MTAPAVQPVVFPADPEELAQVFFTPIVAPTFVVTKLEDADDVENVGAVRVESADISPLFQYHLAAWDLSFLIHAYSPDEIEATQLGLKCIAHAAAARGKTIMGWYIVDVPNVLGGQKLPEPGVEGLTRYRAAVTWRVAGHPA